MKKLKSLFIVILLLLVSLSGCNKDKGFNKKKLWDYLDDYPRYLTETVLEDAAIVFDNEGNLTFEYSELYKDDLYKFSNLISFSYEGDKVYKLEYENPYPEVFENAVFYVDLNYKDNTKFSFGKLNNDKIEYTDYYADIGLTTEELLESIARYETWREDNNEEMGYYFAKVFEDNQFGFGIMNSGFGTVGDVADVKYHGFMYYTVTVDYEGYEGDEMTDPYEPYTIDYVMYYNPRTDYMIIKAYNETIPFVPDVASEGGMGGGGDEDNDFDLIAALSKYDIWIETKPDSGSRYLKVYGDKFDLNELNSGGFIPGVITNIKDNGNMNYTITAYYEGSDKGEYGVPEKSFSKDYQVYYNPEKDVLKVEYYGEWVEFAPDKGIPADKLYNTLAKYDAWVEVTASLTGYFIKAYDGNKLLIALMYSDDSRNGNIENIDYWGKGNYSLSVYYPGFEEPYHKEPSLDSYWINLDYKKEILTINLDGKDIKLVPDKAKTIAEFFNAYRDIYFENENMGYRFEINNGKYQIHTGGYEKQGNYEMFNVKSLKYNGLFVYELIVDMYGKDIKWEVTINDLKQELTVHYITADGYFVDDRFLFPTEY